MITHVEREMIPRPRPGDRDVECIRWFVALPLRLVRNMRSGERLVKLDIENEGNSIILHTQYFFRRFPRLLPSRQLNSTRRRTYLPKTLFRLDSFPQALRFLPQVVQFS